MAEPRRGRKRLKSNPPSWLPDWREPSQYPGYTSPPLQWAWEFLRRNSEYHADVRCANDWPLMPGCVERELASSIKQLQDNLERMSDLERREWQRWEKLQDEQIAKVADLARKWHLLRGILPDPENTNAWQEDDFELPGYLQSCYPARNYYSGKPQGFMCAPRHENEAAVVFDLSEPLTPQLTAAKRRLTWLQSRYVQRKWVEKPAWRPHKPANLQLYLRAFDADTLGASASDIAACLYPGVPDVYGNQQGSRRVKDALREARRLIEGGYASLRID